MFDTSATKDFLDPKTIGTFGGATVAIFAITATLRKAVRLNSLIVPLVLAMALSFFLATNQGSLKDGLGWFIAVVNGCLLFLAVVGANETTDNAAKPKPAGVGEQQGVAPVPRRFIRSFFD